MTEQTSRATKAAGEKLYACTVLRDMWPENPSPDAEQGGRVYAGTVIEVDADTAMRGVETGTLARLRD